MSIKSLEEIQLEASKKKVERLKAANNTTNVIKSPILNDPNTNPCVKEQNESRKCWIDHDFDKTRCKDYYDNYKICIRFWAAIEWERFLSGIRPSLPPPEERPNILKEKMNGFKEGYGFFGIFEP